MDIVPEIANGIILEILLHMLEARLEVSSQGVNITDE